MGKYEYLFERRFFQIVMEEVKRRGILYKDFAELVWGDCEDAPIDKERMLLSLRKKAKTGRPQALKLREAYKMAKVLGLDMARLVWEVERDLDLRLQNFSEETEVDESSE